MERVSTSPEPKEIQLKEAEELLPLIEPEEEDGRIPHERLIARLRLLWDQRRFLFRVAVYGFLLATLVAFLIPKRYESTARLMPPDSQSGSGLALLAALNAKTAGLGGIAGDFLGLKSSSALFVGVLRSRTVEDELIQKFDLKELYWARTMEDARNGLEDRTKVSEDRKSGIITITVTDGSPQRAAAMAQAYVDALNRLVTELTTSSAHRERVFLEERLKEVKRDLDDAAKQFSEFASKNTAIDIKEQGRAMVEAAATLQGQLIVAQTELEGLRQVYTDNNVRVRAVRARIAELKKQLEKLGGAEAGTPAARSQESQSQYPSIRQLPLLGVTYADLYRRTKIQETVFELLTQQYELAKVQEVKEIPTVKLLDQPVVPEKKSFPPRLLIMLLGTLLTAAFGTVWVFGSAHWAATDSKDPGKALAADVFRTLRAQALPASTNGGGLRGIAEKVLGRLRRDGESTTVKK